MVKKEMTDYKKIDNNICPRCGTKLKVAGSLEFDRECNSCGNYYKFQDRGDYYETRFKKDEIK